MISFTQGSVRVELPVEQEYGPAPRYLPTPGTPRPPLVEMPDDDESPEEHLATVDVFGEEVRDLWIGACRQVHWRLPTGGACRQVAPADRCIGACRQVHWRPPTGGACRQVHWRLPTGGARRQVHWRPPTGALAPADRCIGACRQVQA